MIGGVNLAISHACHCTCLLSPLDQEPLSASSASPELWGSSVRQSVFHLPRQPEAHLPLTSHGLQGGSESLVWVLKFPRASLFFIPPSYTLPLNILFAPTCNSPLFSVYGYCVILTKWAFAKEKPGRLVGHFCFA